MLQKWGGLPMEVVREDVTSEKAYQGGHLQVHAPLAV